MAKFWIEPFTKDKHKNHMPEVGQEIDDSGQVIVVEAGRYRLEFLSLEQLDVTIRYFESPNNGSTRVDISGGEHWEFQPWHCRLPAGINNKHNRPNVLNSLRHAKEAYSKDSKYRAACR